MVAPVAGVLAAGAMAAVQMVAVALKVAMRAAGLVAMSVAGMKVAVRAATRDLGWLARPAVSSVVAAHTSPSRWFRTFRRVARRTGGWCQAGLYLGLG